MFRCVEVLDIFPFFKWLCDLPVIIRGHVSNSCFITFIIRNIPCGEMLKMMHKTLATCWSNSFIYHNLQRNDNWFRSFYLQHLLKKQCYMYASLCRSAWYQICISARITAFQRIKVLSNQHLLINANINALHYIHSEREQLWWCSMGLYKYIHVHMMPWRQQC